MENKQNNAASGCSELVAFGNIYRGEIVNYCPLLYSTKKLAEGHALSDAIAIGVEFRGLYIERKKT